MTLLLGNDLWASVEGARVLIAGGSSGIGLAGAAALARLGAKVTIAGRDGGRLASAKASMSSDVETYRLDASDREAIDRMFEEIGPLDHLVITLTGKLGGGHFGSVDLGEFRQAFDEKFWPHLMLAQSGLRALASTGSITFITGASSRKVTPGGSGYVAINGALDLMVPTLAFELAPVRVNAISPGFVDTEWYSHVPKTKMEKAYADAARTLPVRRVGQSSDLAQAIVFVVADNFVTGSVIECDGGVRLIAPTS